MNKAQLISCAVAQVPIGIKDGVAILNAFIGCITSSLASGESVRVAHLGTFSVHDRQPRLGRNPQTGEQIKIAGKRIVRFSPAKEMADKVHASAKAKQPRR